MILPTWVLIAAFQVAAITGVMACILFVRRQARSSHRSLAALFAAMAMANLADRVGLLDEAHALL